MREPQMSNTKSFLAALTITVGAVLWVVMAFDALEYEQTGECRDCILLDKIRSF